MCPEPPGGPTLVAVAHGSRDPEALRTVTALLALVRRLRPGLRVALGHVELNAPLLSETLATLPRGGRAVVVPLLFGRGYHVKHDIPQVIAAAERDPEILHTAPLGPHPLVAEALYGRLREAARRHPAPAPDAVVLAAAGSRDPESAAATERLSALLATRLGGIPVLPGYAAPAVPGAPSVRETAAVLRARGYRRIGLASCFTAPGRFARRCAEAVPGGPAAAPLGAHPALARLVLHRYDRATAGAAPVAGPGRLPSHHAPHVR